MSVDRVAGWLIFAMCLLGSPAVVAACVAYSDRHWHLWAAMPLATVAYLMLTYMAYRQATDEWPA